jgi:hypothetical protein
VGLKPFDQVIGKSAIFIGQVGVFEPFDGFESDQGVRCTFSSHASHSRTIDKQTGE